MSFVIISKRDQQLRETVEALRVVLSRAPWTAEIIVVEGSSCGPADLGVAPGGLRWIRFTPAQEGMVSIPHQRNAGIRAANGAVIVFIDCGCLPDSRWADRLLAPLLSGAECLTAGRTVGRGAVDLYDRHGDNPPAYLSEAPTINLAVARSVFARVGIFDERFQYGSDVDFTWRVNDAGLKIRYVPDAVLSADWGDAARQLRRAWMYGQARARLYRKHPRRLRSALANDPVPFVYGSLLLASPLALRRPALLTLLGPLAWRNRRTRAALTLADHLLLGAGFLWGLSR